MNTQHFFLSRPLHSLFTSPALFICACICVLAVFLRIYKIDSLSPVIAHDEVYYVVEAKTISLDGKDPSGTVSPLSLTPSNPLFAELPGSVMALSAKIFSANPIVAARATHVVLGSVVCIILALISYSLFGQKNLSSIVLALCLLNPWFFQNSRMNFDALFSIFFYLLGIFCVLQKRPVWLLAAFVSFFLGFYQYQGMKLLLVPIVFLSCAYVFRFPTPQKRSWSKILHHNVWLGVFFVSICLVFVVQIARLRGTQAGGRINDLVFFDQELLSQRVNNDRQLALQSRWTPIFSNKLTAMSTIFIEKYIDTFQFNQLFIHIDARRNPFAVWSKGIFYLIDLPLICIAGVVLARQQKYKKESLFLLGMILIAPLPSAINGKDTWLYFRASFLFPWLILLSAFGMWKILQKNKILGFATVFLYMCFVSQFFYEYFVRYPVYGTTDRYFSERVVSSYLKRTSDRSQDAMVLTEEPFFFYSTLLAFTNSIQQRNLDQIHESYHSKNYRLNRWQVDGKCFSPSTQAGSVSIIDSRVSVCEHEQLPDPKQDARVVVIPSLIDSGAQFTIYNDVLCQPFALGQFSHVTKDVFDVEHLSDKDFCENFVIRQL